MRIPKSWVSLITKKVVEDIIAKKLITPKVPMDRLLAETEEIMLNEFMVEDRLNDEVRELLSKHNPEIERNRLDYRKLFDLTKRKLVQERNIIL